VVTGESGTGKELAARAIHNLSNRSENPFVVVNCGAVAANLIESEFFGYRKGAFSGAITDREGLLDAAGNGTLFLDEVGEIPLNLQIKLLRALDGGGYTRVGGTSVRHSDFRLIAATHQDLEDLVRSGRMREDFYYRINAVRLRMPPLRERKDDILMLADYFIEKYNDKDTPHRLSAQEEQMLLNYSWPGNVRELQNVVYRYLTLGTIELTGEVLSKDTVPGEAAEGAGATEGNLSAGIEQLEKKTILDTLKRHKWHIGKSAAALGFSRRTMQRRMNKYDLRR
jgi:transcriptional regulator with PAS, ATPase and Fis domain